MAGVRDPAFWKRFSVAVHMDEEKGMQQLKDDDSWLARQQNKRKQRARVCWAFWAIFLIVIAGVVGVIIWLVESGVLSNIGHSGGENVQSSTD
ncbi:hypothetical protein Q7P37_003731 [Cladosporium fusiforme]